MDETEAEMERWKSPPAIRRVAAMQDDSTCFQCGKRVYEMEKITADEVVYHKPCFRCYHCSRVLSLMNYSALDGRLFCKPHFLEMFRTKADDVGQQNDSDGISPGRDWPSGGDSRDSNIVWQSQDVKEEIPSVPLKDMRNIFENLSQTAVADQQHVSLSKKPSKWDKCSEQRSFDISHYDDDHQNHNMKSDVEGDRDLVHGSSTVFVVEDELPPPAFTKNIVAKFRELEASSVDKPLPLPAKVTPSRSAHSYSSRSDNQSAWHSYSTTEEDVADRSEFTEERGRTEKRLEARQRESSSSPGRSVADELPQEGTARSLLARWRTIEQQAGEDSPRRSSSGSAARRSQSTSRIEVRRHYQDSRARAGDNDDDDDGDMSARVAEYLDVDERQNDYDDRPPVLMTREVLAKFRTMEAEHEEASKQQLPRQQRQSFRWEVKEPVPLSRGNLVVHGDVPRRSVAEADQLSSPNGESTDARESVFQEDELPPPAMTRHLLSMFKSMEDPCSEPPTPETTEKKQAASRSSVHRSPSVDISGYTRAADVGDDFSWSNGDLIEYSPDAGEFENDPVYNADVVRESDRTDYAEMPEQGITRGLLAKFQNAQ